MVKNLPAGQETLVWFLVWKDALEEGMATHSNVLAWRIPWTEESGGLHSVGWERVGHDWATNTHFDLLFFFFHFDFHTLNFWRERQKLYRNHTTALHFSASVPISGQCQSGTLFSDSESSPIHFNLALMLNGKDSHQKFLLLFCKVLDAHLCFYQGAWQLSVG